MDTDIEERFECCVADFEILEGESFVRARTAGVVRNWRNLQAERGVPKRAKKRSTRSHSGAAKRGVGG
jgi:hypothetical protein